MAIPLHFLMRFRKVRGLSKALDDQVNANRYLEEEISTIRNSSQPLETRLNDYEQLLQLMSDELHALRNGRQHDLLPGIMFSPDLQSGQMAKKVLSLLRPMDVVDGSLVRKGGRNDGGYVMLNSHTENTIAYSLGIGDDVSWDL